MRLENEFVVNAPIDRVWAYVLDVERLAPCAPGAELTEVVDARTWKGRLNVKVGPVAMSFAGSVVIQDRDDTGHRAELRADGREQRGRGTAKAVVTAHMEAVEEGTKVVIVTDLSISGTAAQYGRGMIGDISQRMTDEFARCLEERISAQGSIEEVTLSAASDAGRPIKGVRLAMWAAWRAVLRFFSRLFGR